MQLSQAAIHTLVPAEQSRSGRELDQDVHQSGRTRTLQPMHPVYSAVPLAQTGVASTTQNCPPLSRCCVCKNKSTAGTVRDETHAGNVFHRGPLGAAHGAGEVVHVAAELLSVPLHPCAERCARALADVARVTGVGVVVCQVHLLNVGILLRVYHSASASSPAAPGRRGSGGRRTAVAATAQLTSGATSAGCMGRTL